jgi:predicted DCC family thiol-disulfide oxidoreductase YuxK
LVAERVYAVISRNRQLISRLFGCKGACALIPDRAGIGSKVPDPKPQAGS